MVYFLINLVTSIAENFLGLMQSVIHLKVCGIF